jgi:transcriptional antiterminator RfaH
MTHAYLLAVHAGQEHKAMAHLTRQGFDVYCPMTEKRRSHARKVDIVRRALFPGYIFLMKPSEAALSLRPVKSTVGVKDFVKFGGQPAEVSLGLIDNMKSREVNGVIPAPPLSSLLPQGAQVRVLMGAFQDMVATVLSCEAQDRVMVLIDFLSRQVRVRVPGAALEAC